MIIGDKPYDYEDNRTIHLRVWALGQMIWGAFLGGLFISVVIGFVVAIYIFGLFLPEESKQAPSPYSSLTTEQVVVTV